VRVGIREWHAAGQPHDPAVAPDGALWYTAFDANELGRLDARSGDLRTFPLNVPNSGPVGLVADTEGTIWFTASLQGYIGKLDPETGEVTEYPMPNPRARDPRSIVVGDDGKLYFTVEQGNFVGRLDPLTGAIALVEVPTWHAQPSGITVGADGAIYFCEFGTNRIGRLDPVRMRISELVLPDAGSRARRLAVAHDGRIYYTDHARGYLGRVSPESGEVVEWPSPSGTGSKPYAIATTPEGIVWYVETGVHPNTLVRFDPSSNQFDHWRIPSGGGVVHNMVVAPDNQLYLAESGVNKLAIAEIEH
jgi:virginiamycin B lyase